jgi:hypothetical protein
VRNRFVFIGHSPRSRKDCDVTLKWLSFLIDFLRPLILRQVISERMGRNPRPQDARSSSGMGGGKPTFSSRTARVFSAIRLQHVTTHHCSRLVLQRSVEE